MEFICLGRLSAVEFLWGPGPVSRHHEMVLPFFFAYAGLRGAPDTPMATSGRPSSDGRVSAAWRRAFRDRPGAGRPFGRSACRHSHPSGVGHLRKISPWLFATDRCGRTGDGHVYLRGSMSGSTSLEGEHAMLDAILIVVGCGCFALAIAYAYACDRL